MEGAVRGFWDGGKPGRGSLVGTRLQRGFGGAPVPSEGGRRRWDASERRELAEPGGASPALRGVGAAWGAELRKPPRPAGGVSRTRAGRPGVAPRLVGESPEFAVVVSVPGVRDRECRRTGDITRRRVER